jgi:C6 transcription factor Pro1
LVIVTGDSWVSREYLEPDNNISLTWLSDISFHQAWYSIDDRMGVSSKQSTFNSFQDNTNAHMANNHAANVPTCWRDEYVDVDLSVSESIGLIQPLLSEAPTSPIVVQDRTTGEMTSVGLTATRIISEQDTKVLEDSSSTYQGLFASYQESSIITGAFEAPTTIKQVISDGHCSEEAALLMHYFDQVFYTQFPFYGSLASLRNRGWLYTLLTEDQPIYHATLALSQCHQYIAYSTANGIGCDPNGEYGKAKHYVFASRHLQESLRLVHTWGVIRSIRTLACILQLLFIQVRLNFQLTCRYIIYLIALKIFSGVKGDWALYLRAAAAPAHMLAKAKIALSNSDVPYKEHYSEWQELELLSSEYSVAANFLLGAFIWLDILACASTRSTLVLDVNHSLLLASGDIHLDNMIGCENWALNSIARISALDSWRTNQEKDGRLSMAELVKRSTQIEQDVRERLGTISHHRSHHTGQLSDIIRRFPRTASAEITKVYALSALTYLHVVVSGALTSLPEITESISSTLHAFKSLSDPNLMQNLVWPFCVTGCLVSDAQKSAIYSLVAEEHMHERAFKVSQASLELIEKCWRERKTTSVNHDWASVMNSMGHHALLV